MQHYVMSRDEALKMYMFLVLNPTKSNLVIDQEADQVYFNEKSNQDAPAVL